MGSEITAFEIRAFERGDQAAARAIIIEGLSEHLGPFEPERHPDLDDIARSFEVFLVVTHDGAVVGTGGLRLESPAVAHVGRIATARAFRGRGAARLVLEHLIRIAKERHLTRLVLETGHDWTDAIRWYERVGFRQVGSFVDRFGFHGVEYELQLTPHVEP
jgi:ribosomal protein S18 acetylase RimI-like enzyme